MIPQVFRTSQGRMWHWSNGTHAACTGGFVDLTRGMAPVSVDVRDRCTVHGCRVRWDGWLRATLIGALSDWNARLLAEAEAREVAA